MEQECQLLKSELSFKEKEIELILDYNKKVNTDYVRDIHFLINQIEDLKMYYTDIITDKIKESDQLNQLIYSKESSYNLLIAQKKQ